MWVDKGVLSCDLPFMVVWLLIRLQREVLIAACCLFCMGAFPVPRAMCIEQAELSSDSLQFGIFS